jgi:hypothetical protein
MGLGKVCVECHTDVVCIYIFLERSQSNRRGGNLFLAYLVSTAHEDFWTVSKKQYSLNESQFKNVKTCLGAEWWQLVNKILY